MFFLILFINLFKSCVKKFTTFSYSSKPLSTRATIRRISFLYAMRANRLSKGNCRHSASYFRFLTKIANFCYTSVAPRWKYRKSSTKTNLTADSSSISAFSVRLRNANSPHFIHNFWQKVKKYYEYGNTQIFFLLLCYIFMHLMSSGCGVYYGRCVCCSSNRH